MIQTAGGARALIWAALSWLQLGLLPPALDFKDPKAPTWPAWAGALSSRPRSKGMLMLNMPFCMPFVTFVPFCPFVLCF